MRECLPAVSSVICLKSSSIAVTTDGQQVKNKKSFFQFPRDMKCEDHSGNGGGKYLRLPNFLLRKGLFCMGCTTFKQSDCFKVLMNYFRASLWYCSMLSCLFSSQYMINVCYLCQNIELSWNREFNKDIIIQTQFYFRIFRYDLRYVKSSLRNLLFVNLKWSNCYKNIYSVFKNIS